MSLQGLAALQFALTADLLSRNIHHRHSRKLGRRSHYDPPSHPRRGGASGTLERGRHQLRLWRELPKNQTPEEQKAVGGAQQQKARAPSGLFHNPGGVGGEGSGTGGGDRTEGGGTPSGWQRSQRAQPTAAVAGCCPHTQGLHARPLFVSVMSSRNKHVRWKGIETFYCYFISTI